jgi:hypothetical protein
MNSLIFLSVLCIIYYCIYKWYPHYLEEKYHIYFGIFVSVYLFIVYMFVYEKEFMYKMFKNIYDTSRQPLYSFNAQESNSQLYNSLNPNQDIKSMLAQKQMGRCAKCHNHIISQDIPFYKLKYLIPLQNGGKNEINNLGLVCPTCMF